jgi:hypothetical protein
VAFSSVAAGSRARLRVTTVPVVTSALVEMIVLVAMIAHHASAFIPTTT